MYYTIFEASDVTDALMDSVREVVEGWYGDCQRIDWENVIDRVEERGLDDRDLGFGNDLDSPAIRKIKRLIREERRSS